MGNKIADLLVFLGLDSSKFVSGMSKAQKQTKNFHAGLKTAAVAVGAAVLAGAVSSIKEASKAEDAQWRLIAVLKTLIGTTETTYQSFLNMSQKQRTLSIYGDEEILDGMTQLTKITGDYNFTLSHMGLLMDMATAKNGDFEGAAQTLGMAFLGNTRGLRQYGLILDENTSKEVILEKLQAMYAGTSKSRTLSASGQVKQLKNDIDEAKEGIGGFLFKMGASLKDVFSSKSAEEVNARFDTLHKKGTQAIAKWDEMKAAAVQRGPGDEAAAAAKLEKEIELQERLRTEAQTTADITAGVMSTLVETMLDSSATVNEKMAGILRAGLSGILDFYIIQARALLALEIGKAIGTVGITSPAVVGVAAQLVVLEGLKAAVGTISLAQGGIVSQPTRAIVGDSSSPEVVAPLHKLQPMITKAVNNSMNNKFQIIINGGASGDMVRKEIIPQLELYFRRKGRVFNGSN
jgi:hypothetical protein